MLIATYVINLDMSTERLGLISSRLDALDIPFERVVAFDGRKLDMATVDGYDADRAVQYMGRRLVGGEIGCYRSHLAAAERFLASDARYALVLEDDAQLLCNPKMLLAEALPDLDAADPDWLLLNIGNNKLKYTSFMSRYNLDDRDYVLVAAHYFPMTTSAIVWSREGARRFVEEHRSIFAPVDNYFRYWLTREGHGYSFWPAPVTTTDAASIIDASASASRQKADRKWNYGFLRYRRFVGEKLIAIGKKWRFRAQHGFGPHLSSKIILQPSRQSQPVPDP